MIEKAKSFTDLLVWKEAHKLALTVYRITDKFPNKEIYTLVSQMRRCGISVSSNIAEGFTRHNRKEKIQFYYMALASLTELQNQLLISRDVGYIEQKEFAQIAEQSVLVGKLLNGLIRAVQKS